MEYRLIRSKRKSLAVIVGRDGGAEVRAPLRMPASEIDRFVQSKHVWIEQKQALMRKRAEERDAFAVEIGSLLPCLGREIPVLEGAKAEWDGEAFRVNPAKLVKPQVIGLYRKLARQDLARRVDRWAPLAGVRPLSLRITGASTRFGSCSGKNGICFTWKLMLAPPGLADYVVVHELCHILQHNHSARFWAEVQRLLPDYRERERALKRFGESLQTQNWD